MYPIKFQPLYYEKIWGGRCLNDFRNDLPEGLIGESWDVACHPNGISVIINGEYEGQLLEQLIEVNEEKILGKRVVQCNEVFNYKRKFPLLMKLINASAPLSVQVHPNDDYGFEKEKEPGKTECWYIVDAQENGSIIMGTQNNITQEEFEKAILNGRLDGVLMKIKVNKGDFFYIPSGMVHAIGSGVTIVEIQQNSDTTYRVYDYGRQRELHLDKAMDVIDFSLSPVKINKPKIFIQGNSIRNLTTCDYFQVDEITISNEITLEHTGDYFEIITCVEGEGKIENKYWSGDIKKGDSFLIPSNCIETNIKGEVTLLKSLPYPSEY